MTGWAAAGETEHVADLGIVILHRTLITLPLVACDIASHCNAILARRRNRNGGTEVYSVGEFSQPIVGEPEIDTFRRPSQTLQPDPPAFQVRRANTTVITVDPHVDVTHIILGEVPDADRKGSDSTCALGS